MPDRLETILESTEAERLATGFEFTEGPLWHPEGYLLFVNNRRNLIYRLVPGGEPEVIREDSGSANGLTFDLEGRLVMCEGDNRQVTRWEPDGTITVIADRWEGKRLNRPNDVVCRSDAIISSTLLGNSSNRSAKARIRRPDKAPQSSLPRKTASSAARSMEAP